MFSNCFVTDFSCLQRNCFHPHIQKVFLKKYLKSKLCNDDSKDSKFNEALLTVYCVHLLNVRFPYCIFITDTATKLGILSFNPENYLFVHKFVGFFFKNT